MRFPHTKPYFVEVRLSWNGKTYDEFNVVEAKNEDHAFVRIARILDQRTPKQEWKILRIVQWEE